MIAEAIALRLWKPSRSGAGWIACCPAHDDSTPSLSIGEDNGRVLYKCHGGCSQDAVGQALRRLGLLDLAMNDLPPPPKLQDGGALYDARKVERARKILRESSPASGSLVQQYLVSRGINAMPKQLRFHPNLWHSKGVSFPAMITCPTNPLTGKPTGGIHRTWLSHDGQGKAPIEPNKKILGPYRGGVVVLGSHVDGEPILIGEGIETVLAGVQAKGFLGLAALSAGNLTQLELPVRLSDIIILADNDDNHAGQNAATNLAKRLSCNGRRVRIAMPPATGDMNDLLISTGVQ